MTAKTKKLLDEALQLPPNEREALAGELFESLDGDDAGVEEVWQAEIGRRIAELDQGNAKPIPWEDAKRLIFGDADDSPRN